jgi:hypothetical protein
MGIKTLIDALSKVAKEPNATDDGLRAAQRHVQEFLDQYGGDPYVGIGEVNKAVRAEAEASPSEKDFWKAVEEYVVLPHRFRP